MHGPRTLLVRLAQACLAWGGLACMAHSAELPEYQLKAAFLYNFALFTEWPADTGPSITLCVINGDGFRGELEQLQGQAIGARRFDVRRVPDAEATQGCQLVFLPKGPPSHLARSMRLLADRRHLLVIGDSPEAARAGVGINMSIQDARVTFDVNRKAIQDAGLSLSSKLLRLAQNVR